MATNMLSPRHIQNFSEAQSLEPHWGYADRAVPCTNDAGSCAYLDSVYHSHDLGMLYSGIIWATVGAILLFMGIATRMYRASKHSNSTELEEFISHSPGPSGLIPRAKTSVSALSRRWLLPEFSRSIFGRTSRLQVAVLLAFTGYLAIFTFAGIVYQKWVTPVKKMPGIYNTRTGLGPFSDRIGLLAYALLPFSIMLSSRESLLSLITGIPYQQFNFLHRWLGYIIFVQSCVHTIGWTVIEVKLYQPQPSVGREWIKQLYMIWGVVAQIFIVMLFVLSLGPVIRITGYEFFRKAHYVLAMLFIGACWGHWEQLKCFLLPALILWFVDRGTRLLRTWLIHYQVIDGKMGYTNACARMTLFPDERNGDIVRLDFEYPHDAWKVGQHFYLCLPELSIWQSHPFTPLSLSQYGASAQQHSYIVRAKKGETHKLAKLAQQQSEKQQPSTPVILTGPYGENIMSSLEASTNVLCVAGGSGITFLLPVLLSLAQRPVIKDRKIELVWAVRLESDVEWVRNEISTLENAAGSHAIGLNIYITRECCTVSKTMSKDASAESRQSKASSTSSDDEMQAVSKQTESAVAEVTATSSGHILRRPDLHEVVANFVQGTIRGSTIVYASGPGGMISDLREAVAKCNSGSKVWKGDRRFDVNLISDNRLEW